MNDVLENGSTLKRHHNFKVMDAEVLGRAAEADRCFVCSYIGFPRPLNQEQGRII